MGERESDGEQGSAGAAAGSPASFRLSREQAAELHVLDSSPSTNTALVELSRGPDAVPDFAVVVTADQTAGRGRLGRVWSSPPGAGLAISVLLRPADSGGRPVSPDRLGWLPLAAGLAMTRAVRGLLPQRDDVALKWPNDVLIGDRKVCGVLTELLPSLDGVVIGAGLNLLATADQLPVPTATSLALAGADTGGADTGGAETGDSDGAPLADRALAGFLRELREVTGRYIDAGSDAEASGLREAVSAACGTLGRPVRVELPGVAGPGARAGREVLGTAVELDGDGRLLVRLDDGHILPVSAGDVTHLRHHS